MHACVSELGAGTDVISSDYLNGKTKKRERLDRVSTWQAHDFMYE
jgi:hypothetical protein